MTPAEPQVGAVTMMPPAAFSSATAKAKAKALSRPMPLPMGMVCVPERSRRPPALCHTPSVPGSLPPAA